MDLVEDAVSSSCSGSSSWSGDDDDSDRQERGMLQGHTSGSDDGTTFGGTAMSGGSRNPRGPSPTQSQQFSLSQTARQLDLPSPARRLPASPFKGFERKQLQRRLLEVHARRTMPILASLHMDSTAHRTRVAAQPDRGKLLVQLEVQRGFSVNALTALSKRSTRLVTQLPVDLQERKSEVSVVLRHEGTFGDEVRVRHPQFTPLSAALLREMGYDAAAEEFQRKHEQQSQERRRRSRRTHDGSQSPTHRQPRQSESFSSFREKLRRSIAVATTVASDEPLPPPSGGPVEPHGGVGGGGAQDENPNAVVRLFPHIPLEMLPPRLIFSHADTGRRTPSLRPPRDEGEDALSPPWHLRSEQREKRRMELADDVARIVSVGLDGDGLAADASPGSAATKSSGESATIKGSGSGSGSGGVPAAAGGQGGTSLAATLGLVGSQEFVEVEATPLLASAAVDDRSWGLGIRDAQGDAAQRLRLRMDAASQMAPSNTPVAFGAVDHLIEVCAPIKTDYIGGGDDGELRHETTMEWVPSAGTKRRVSLKIPHAHDARDDTLLVLSVGVCGASEDTSFAYADAEVNAEWFASVMSQVGARTTLLRGYDATQEAIREAIGYLVGQARKSYAQGRQPKMLLYFSGKCRLSEGDDLLFSSHDAFPLLADPLEQYAPLAINLHELATKYVQLDVENATDEALRNMLGSSSRELNDPEKERWCYPVVIYDTTVDRAFKKTDPHFRRLTKPREKLDFWRETYYGGILALQHEGATLSVRCSARHHGLVVYYVCKAAEGRLTGKQQHIGSINQIAQFVAEKLRARNLPSMEMRCSPLPDTFTLRTTEEIFHPAKCLYPSLASKREAKRVRERKSCRWTLYCEVGIEYRVNPTLFVTQLTKRVKEILYLRQKTRPKNAPPLMLWLGSRRMEHRFYLAVDDDSTTDVFRYNLISSITRSDLISKSGSGRYYVEASQESIEHNRFEYVRGEHCMLAHSQGVGHNRWTHNPFVQGMAHSETMGGLRSHSDADIDFVYVLGECMARQKEIEILSFMEGKHATELLTIHGGGSISDLRRMFKFIRLGLLDIVFCKNCRVLRVEVTALGENEEEERAAVTIQKLVRRYLTSRVMKSRLLAAGSYVRQQLQMWVDVFDGFLESLHKWHIDFQQEAFTALENCQTRCRREIRSEAHENLLHLHAHRVEEWVYLESSCRELLERSELVEKWSLRFYRAVMPDYWQATHDTRFASAMEHCIRDETQRRMQNVTNEFGERFQLRQRARQDYQEVVAALLAAQPKGKKSRKPKLDYTVPLSKLLRY